MGRTTRVATSVVGIMIATVLVFGITLVGRTGSSAFAAPLQATATATAGTTGGTAATATATAGTTGGTTGGTATTATAGTTGGTTGGATATATAPGNLPNTGAESNVGLLFMGAAALLVLGIAVSGVLALRRGQES